MWLVVVMLLYGGLLAAGFESATLVMTSKGSQEIAQLKQGQILRGPTDSHYTVLQSKKIHYCHSTIILTCGSTKLIIDTKQRFFDATEHVWVRADELHAGQWLATIFNQPIRIELIEHCNEPNVIIQISVNHPHIFAVSEQGILAHNEPITAVCFFYCGPPIVAMMTPIIIAAAKGISIGLTTYVSWIWTKNILKNAGAFSSIKNFLQSAWDKVRSKFSRKKANSEVKGSCGTSALMPNQTELPVCGLPLPLPWQILPGACQINLESKSEQVKTCEVITPEEKSFTCGTNQQKVNDVEEIDHALLDSDYVVCRKNPGKKQKNKAKDRLQGLKGPAGPHGTYDEPDNGYHGRNDTAIKSKAPRNGQQALDNSIRVVTTNGDPKKNRVAIIDDEFVVFQFTRSDPIIGEIYHGYVADWEGLRKDIKGTLKQNKLVKEDGTLIKK